MHAMQYEITLPADYDMGIIERRVAARGPLLDDLAGLGLKAYAVRRRGREASAVNEYAPFYLWNSVERMTAFILGAGFRGLCDAFGRPSVRHWVGLTFEAGNAFEARPRAATRTVNHMGPDDELSPLPAGLDLAARHRDHPDLHSTALLLDPHHWELVRFCLWTGKTAAPGAPGTRYEVLHLSAPELEVLPSAAVVETGPMLRRT